MVGDTDTYDGADDAHSPIGRGETEAEAIEDLMAQIEERDDKTLTAELAAEMQAAAISDGDLLVWNVTANPSDYPDSITARPFSARGNAPYNAVLSAATLDELRGKLPPGLTMIARTKADDPVIVESWL